MYFAIYHYYGCKYGIKKDFAQGIETATEAVGIAADIMADNNSTTKAQRMPLGNWLCTVFIYNEAGDVVAAIDQQPGQPRHVLTPSSQKSLQPLQSKNL